MAQPARPAVLLVGHGSTRSGASAEPVLDLADRLRERGFGEVGTGFWKEEPFLHQALDALRGARVVVLPVFMAEGYFTRTVVPRELGLSYDENERAGRSIRLLRPLGTAAALDELVLDRARAAAGVPGASTREVALVVTGHGTPRDPGSARSVLDLCARLDGRSGFARVAPAFIDQNPRLEAVVAAATEPHIIVVPFLVAEGWHGGTTVPESLGVDGGRSGRVRYAQPVGTHPGIVDVVERMLLEAEPESARAESSDGAAPLERAESALAAFVRGRGRGSARLLDVEVRNADADGWELRHVQDADEPRDRLEAIADALALERMARRTALGAYRPLRTAADLATGWRHDARTPRGLADALVALYGPALTHWHLGERDGGPHRSSFRETAARQTGIYARLAQVEPAAVEAGIARVCEGCPCGRRRAWEIDRVTAIAQKQTSARGTMIVPCPAPCPVLLTAVLELVGTEALEPEAD